jgi:hypothetical protein
MVADFFTGMMPIFLYVLYKDQWCEHYQIEEKQFKERFKRAFEMTHLAYHKTLLKELSEKK